MKIIAALTLAMVIAFTDVPRAQDLDGTNPVNAGSAQTAAIKVTDEIYQASGFANTFLVRTPGGNVIVDTSNPIQAPRHKKLLEAVDAGPIKFIILTHGHPDHTGGVKLWRGPETKLITQRNFVEFTAYQQRLGGYFARSNAAQFGGLAGSRPSGAVWSGEKDEGLKPDILFDDHYEFELGGIQFEIFRTPGETPDHLTVWIPKFKAAFVGDNYYASFPNMYTLRGTPARFALDYVNSLNKVLSLKPEIVLPSHGTALKGNAQIEKQLTKYRDAILYVHDATVKGMNEGKDVFTLMREIKLPPELNVGEGYGKISWSVRGIYEGYVGWFDGNPATMYEWPASSAYPEAVKLAGGADAVGKRAMELVAGGQEIQGLHLADMALAADPKNTTALNARIAALEALQKKARNSNEQGWLKFGIKQAQQKLSEAAGAFTQTK